MMDHATIAGFSKCHCQHCNGHIEFETAQVGRTITCPHCELDTVLFIPGAAIQQDQLCEVGCPYVVRGFDFDYVGLLWLKVLQWRNGKWVIDPEHCYETGLPRRLAREQPAPHPDHEDVVALAQQIKRAYRILFTRSMRGVYVWLEDPTTVRAAKSYLNTPYLPDELAPL